MSLLRLKHIFARFRNGYRRAFISDHEIEQMQAWSISAELAAVHPTVALQATPEISRLIQWAKQLHPQVAAASQSRSPDVATPSI